MDAITKARYLLATALTAWAVQAAMTLQQIL